MSEFWARKHLYTRGAQIAYILMLISIFGGSSVAMSADSYWPLLIGIAMGVVFYFVGRSANQSAPS